MLDPTLPVAVVNLDEWLAKPHDRAVAEWDGLRYQKRRETMRGLLAHRDVRVLSLLLAIMRQPEEHLHRDLIECMQHVPIDFLHEGLRHHARLPAEPSGQAARALMLRLDVTPFADVSPDATKRAAQGEALLAALRGDDAWLRARAAQYLGTYGNGEHVEGALARAAKRDPVPEVCWHARRAAVNLLEGRVSHRVSCPRCGQLRDLDKLLDDVMTLVLVDECRHSMPGLGWNRGHWHLDKLRKRHGGALVPSLLRQLHGAEKAMTVNTIVESLEQLSAFHNASWISPLVHALQVDGAWQDRIAALLEPLGSAGIDALIDTLRRTPDPYEVAKLLVFRGRMEGLSRLLARLPQHAERPVEPAEDPAATVVEHLWFPHDVPNSPRGDQRAIEIAAALDALLASRAADVSNVQLEQLARLQDVHITTGGCCVSYLVVRFYRVRRRAADELYRRSGRP